MTSFGKVILSGEHSAVYDQPAVAASVSLEIAAELQAADKQTSPFVQNLLNLFQQKFSVDLAKFSIVFSGDLPIGSGLGSSAATAHAAFQTLAERFQQKISDDEMITLIQESERFVHGHPSGLDAVAVVKKGVVQFQRQGEKFSYAELPNEKILIEQFFLIQSGQPEESTKKMIELVREVQQTSDGEHAIQEIGKITTQLISDLRTDTTLDFDWMTANERYLEELQIVGEKAQEMIREIESEGGFAKVTGGGGFTKGSGMILVHHADSEKFSQFLRKKAWPFYAVQLGKK